MKKAASFASITSALAASCIAGGPIESSISPATFLAPYKKAVEAMEGKEWNIAETELIHLGLPTSDSIKIWYSLADHSDSSVPMQVLLKPDSSVGSHKPDLNVQHTKNLTYGTGTLVVSGLEPDTRYSMILRGGGLKTERMVIANTAPSEKKAFSFLAASCFLPWNYSRADKTFITKETATILDALQDRAGARVAGTAGPDFHLGLGDQIYVDPGADSDACIAYLHGKKSERLRGEMKDIPEVLRNLYRYQFGLRPFNKALSTIPSAMMWDDHDIRDGWGSQDDENSPGWKTYYESAREAFLGFQASRNPGFEVVNDVGRWESASGAPPRTCVDSNEMNFQFNWGAASFFVSDGRSARDWNKRTGMSEMQLEQVRLWLNNLSKRSDESLVYVFSYSVPLFGGSAMLGKAAAKIPGGDRDDAAERAYVNERERSALLEALLGHAELHSKHRLLVISGDVHYSALQIARSKKNGRILGYEVTTSGLAQTAFNDKGPFWLTVAKSTKYATIDDYGFYAGPCFAEFFIGAPQLDGPPEVKVLFYPGSQRESALRSSRLKTDSALALNVGDVNVDFAIKPECYPPNSTRWFFWPFRKVTISHLAEYTILDRWLGTGRAVPAGNPSDRASGWEK